jgi:hypothetical protein
VAPKQYFYPYGWNEEFHEDCITQDTYCIHLWEKSWAEKEKTKNLTSRLQDFLQSYPSIFRGKHSSAALEIAIRFTEAISTNGKSLSRNMPW